MQNLLYFDICAIPIFLMILITVFVRKMTKGMTNRFFIALIVLSTIAAVSDVIMELACKTLPLSDTRLFVSDVFIYLYYVSRAGSVYIYFFFVFSITGTWYRVRPIIQKILCSIPFAAQLTLFAANPFTGMIFTVTAEDGYRRGGYIMLSYGISMMYALVGTLYLIWCRRLLRKQKLLSLISLYIFTAGAALFQFFFPHFLVEMIATAISFILVILFVLRPEEISDASVGSLSYRAYRTDLRKILMTKQRIQIAAVRFVNAYELRAYMGQDGYLNYMSHIIQQLNALFRKERVFFDIYYEDPANIYIIIEDTDYDVKECVKRFYGEFSRKSEKEVSASSRVIPKVCRIMLPDDLDDFDEIIRLGHEFADQMPPNQLYTDASEIMSSRDYLILSHMDIILNRAIQDRKFEMYYQPIYSFKRGKFISAEALIRLFDDEYGYVSPGLFIPAAERKGAILPIGDFVLEEVHKFISEHDLAELGLDYIEINLSVAQCLQEELPEKLAFLSEKYGVSPEQINLEITETTYENVSGVMDINLQVLSGMGYTFSLDDYGTGYSNMQRVSKLPLKMIKLDKSLVDDMRSDDGMLIMRNTVKMMRDIDKELVAEGVETKENLDHLESMGCHFIQGYYFSKPLSVKDFVSFVKRYNVGKGA